MVRGLPASCPVAHVGSFRQAVTVIVLENVPTPRVLARAGTTVAVPVEPDTVMNTLETAAPLTTTVMYSVPLETPETLPVTGLDAGVTPGLIVLNASVLVERLKLGPPPPGEPPPPPPHAVRDHTSKHGTTPRPKQPTIFILPLPDCQFFSNAKSRARHSATPLFFVRRQLFERVEVGKGL